MYRKSYPYTDEDVAKKSKIQEQNVYGILSNLCDFLRGLKPNGNYWTLK